MWSAICARHFGPKDRGKELVEEICSFCHGLARLKGQEYTRDEWENVTKGMIFEGAPVTRRGVFLDSGLSREEFRAGRAGNRGEVMRRTRSDTCVLSLSAAVTPMLAHHSIAAEYDDKKPITLRGTVTKFDWTNPHVYV